MNFINCGKTLFLIIVVAGLSGCVGYSTPVPETPDDSLITGQPCMPPCWQSLTPGQSTWEEVSKFLEISPLVKGNFVSIDTEKTDKAFTQPWWWANEDRDPQRMNTFAVDQEGKLSAINLTPNTTIMVSQIIQAYGAPTYITAARSAPGRRRGIVFTALYVNQQLEINWLEEAGVNGGQFCPTLDAPIYQAAYYSSNLTEASENRLKDMAPREGFILLDGSSIVKVVDGNAQISCFEIP